MKDKFDKGFGETKQPEIRCPKCGCECYTNSLDEIICPNCGIISNNRKLDKYLSDSSIG